METAFKWLQACALLLSALVLAKWICRYSAGWLTYFFLFWKTLKQQRRGFPGQGKRLKVILCGFSRTGTMSLMTALDTLGFPCFHGTHLTRPPTGDLFIKAFTYGNPKDWLKLLDGYASIADLAALSSYKDLMKIFPEAKVILNIRDPNRWYDSFSKTLTKTTHGSDRNFIFKLLTPLLADYFQVAVYDKFFSGNPQDRETCISAFTDHIEEVKQHVAPENLLVYDIEKEKGWKTLCEFMEVPIPNVPFPRVNDREAFGLLVKGTAFIHIMVLFLYVSSIIYIVFRIVA
ncbi:hypothetical protein KP509_05G010800 [Ceratopteris richardii]|uniref:Sulfotransferase n=3 Tax=Ceratopteris richardii TaxID=49495 RepID=A0A8T2UJB4_CERRI|nr:hypothetical protein KP509_05G010800 [Ceratopteris richardii]